MRVLVCGGRDFHDYTLLSNTLRRIHEKVRITVVVHGAARGADTLGDQWAAWRNIRREPYPADWGKHGNAAGPLRNQRMLDEGLPDLVVAFPGGKGTADMVRRARVADVRVIEVKEE